MNNKNTIIIAAYNKPDLLYLYLEQLYSDTDIINYNIQIHTEEGYDLEQDFVISHYKKLNPNVSINQIIKPKNPKYKLPGFYNILSSYLYAADQKDSGEFVIVGEEDMLPTKDYIKFNKYIYNNFLKKFPRIMGAAHKRRPEAEIDGEPEVLMGDYQCTSLSVISIDSINKYLRPFLSDELIYIDPVKFYFEKFPNSRIGVYDHTHHDGAIERIMEYFKLFVLKPDQARSMHVGLSGVFCKGQPPQGTFEERISQWRDLIKDGDKLRSLSNLPQDLVVTDPNGPKWNELKLDIDRNLCKASSWWYDINNDFKTYINNEKSNTNGG